MITVNKEHNKSVTRCVQFALYYSSLSEAIESLTQLHIMAVKEGAFPDTIQFTTDDDEVRMNWWQPKTDEDYRAEAGRIEKVEEAQRRELLRLIDKFGIPAEVLK